MKRLFALVLALGLSLGAVQQARAIDVVPSGVMDFVFVYSSGALWDQGFQENPGGNGFDRFGARQRSRIQIDFIANENLRGVMMLQFGTWEWGDTDGSTWDGAGAALDTTNESALVHRLYLDFNFPDSPVNMKMGLMDLVLPYATFGQPVFGNHVAAVTATVGLNDNASLTGFWARPFRNTGSWTKNKNNDMDVFGLWANLDYDSFSLAPWVSYASIGNNSGWWQREFFMDDADFQSLGWEFENSDWWGAGLALTVRPTDSLTVKFDGMYAALENDARKGGSEAPEGGGYYFALAVDYAMDWGTPGIFAIYSSGDKAEKEGKFNRIASIAYDDAIWPTRMAFGGSLTCANDSYLSYTGSGMWLVGLQVADLSWIENVYHYARVAYMRGTNHVDSQIADPTSWGQVPVLGNYIPLVKEDQVWEFGFDTYWQMYENLTVGLELGYMHFDATSKNNRDDRFDREGVFSGNLIFRFGF